MKSQTFDGDASIGGTFGTLLPAMPACVVGKTTGLLVALGDILNFDTVLFDPLGMYNNGTQGPAGTARVTIPVTGLYYIGVSIGAAGSNGGVRIENNTGSTVYTQAATVSAQYAFGAFTVNLTAGTQLKAFSYQGAFTAIAGTNACNMVVVRVA